MPDTTHEDRFLDVLQFLTGREVAQEISMPRKARRLDAVCRFEADGAPWLFGPLRVACADRTVLFEHESSPLTVDKVASAWVGLAWLSWHRVRRFRGRRPAVQAIVVDTTRPPLAVIVADGVREDLTDVIPTLSRTEWPGIWATFNTGEGAFDHGGLLVVDTRTVLAGEGFGFWFWLGQVADSAEAEARLSALLADSKLPTVDKRALQEAVMNGQIQVSDVERETMAQRVRREGREEGREEGARAALLALAARFAPEALPSLRAIRNVEALQQAVDAALARRLGG